VKDCLAIRAQSISPFYVMELLERAKQLEVLGRDVIHMEIGEPDFPTPPAIVKAGIKHLSTGNLKYTSAAGLLELRKKIAQYYWDNYRVEIPIQRIFITPGASGAFLLALGASLNSGEEILMADPCYPCNSNFVKLFDGVPKTIPVDAATNYQLTDDLISAHWTAKSKGVLIASPSNPTGTLIDRLMFEKAIETVNSLGGCFFSDEIYHGLVYGTKAATALEFSDDVFVINSFSKYFGMTGWRLGWLIAPANFVEVTEKLAQNIFIASGSHSQYAALAAFDQDNLAELEQRRIVFAERRDFLYEQLIRLGFKVPIKPEGAFYIYADCSNFTDDSFHFAKALLETEAVAVTPGKDFGLNHPKRFIRFAYTASIDKIAIAMQRLEKFMNQG
jgi:aspartate/methionine/tyrosine aminotransferase